MELWSDGLKSKEHMLCFRAYRNMTMRSVKVIDQK
jgi:hypothetical protein